MQNDLAKGKEKRALEKKEQKWFGRGKALKTYLLLSGYNHDHGHWRLENSKLT